MNQETNQKHIISVPLNNDLFRALGRAYVNYVYKHLKSAGTNKSTKEKDEAYADAEMYLNNSFISSCPERQRFLGLYLDQRDKLYDK